MHIQRKYQKLLDYLENKQSIIVLGPRGSGKTYFLKKTLEESGFNHLKINLLEQKTFKSYLKDTSLFYKEIKFAFEENKKFKKKDTLKKEFIVFVDEIQLLPELLNEVQRLIDEESPELFFILTGSSARKLKRSNSNLLAGRAILFNFFPLDFKEHDIKNNLDQTLQFGLLPKVIVQKNQEINISYLETYINLYLKEEIQQESEIRNLSGFSRFLELAATENSNSVNYSKIARAANITPVTVKEYFQILEDTLIAYQVPAWSYSLREQLQQSPKFYFFDNGVLNALLGDLKVDLKSATYRYRKLFENLVVTELIKEISKKGSPLKLYNYRTKRGKEIDLILQKTPNSKPIAIEIQSSENPEPAKLKEIKNFKEMFPESEAYVFCRAERSYQEDGIIFINYLEGIERVLGSNLRS